MQRFVVNIKAFFPLQWVSLGCLWETEAVWFVGYLLPPNMVTV